MWVTILPCRARVVKMKYFAARWVVTIHVRQSPEAEANGGDEGTLYSRVPAPVQASWGENP